MKVEAAIHVIVPPGRYFLGDPCYAVPDKLWDSLLQSCDYFRHPVGKAGGYEVLAFSTAYGDGTYRDSRRRHEFPVDAGIIGLVPAELAEKNPDVQAWGKDVPGAWVHFHMDTKCVKRDGILQFGDYLINTEDEED